MTISSTTTLDYQSDTMLTAALQLAGQLESSETPNVYDLEMSRRFLNLELFTLQAEGVVLRSVTRTTATLTSSTASYALGASVIDLEPSQGGMAGTVNTSGEPETPVNLLSRAQYMGISDKTTTGVPTGVYVEKLAVITLYFWPVPDDTYTFNYAKVGLLADITDGANTLDLHRRWLQAMTYAVAASIALAKSMPMNLVSFLRSEAERLKAICRADDHQRGPTRFRLRHRGRNF